MLAVKRGRFFKTYRGIESNPMGKSSMQLNLKLNAVDHARLKVLADHFTCTPQEALRRLIREVADALALSQAKDHTAP